MESLQFHVVHTRKQVSLPDPNVIVLEPTSWDDYGTKCSFAALVATRGHLEPVGIWKIVDTSNPHAARTVLPSRFSELPSEYVSLGQQVSAYQRLTRLPHNLSIFFLRGIRDVVFRPVPSLQSVDWFKKSVGRFASARAALEHAGDVLQATGLLEHKLAERDPRSSVLLGVRAQLEGFPNRHEFDLTFARSGPDAELKRLVVLVGPNGSGKTQLLAALARALSGLESESLSATPEKPFAQVIAVAYGAFDHFLLPRLPSAPISYVYCGLRVPSAGARIVLDINAAIERAATQISALHASDRRAPWERALRIVGLEDLVKPPANAGGPATRDFLLTRLSAGQKLAALTLTNLATHLEADSIVLHDEPETHLHPTLLSALLRAIRSLLGHFRAYALIATHSLIPVQETPAKNVLIIDRFDDGSIRIFRPAQQCFATPLDEISRTVFRAQPEDQNFRATLEDLSQRFSTAEIETIFDHDNSLGLQLFFARTPR